MKARRRQAQQRVDGVADLLAQLLGTRRFAAVRQCRCPAGEIDGDIRRRVRDVPVTPRYGCRGTTPPSALRDEDRSASDSALTARTSPGRRSQVSAVQRSGQFVKQQRNCRRPSDARAARWRKTRCATAAMLISPDVAVGSPPDPPGAGFVDGWPILPGHTSVLEGSSVPPTLRQEQPRPAGTPRRQSCREPVRHRSDKTGPTSGVSKPAINTAAALRPDAPAGTGRSRVRRTGRSDPSTWVGP